MVDTAVVSRARTTTLLHEVTAGHDPGQVAVRFRGAELTYGELERRSNQLAHALIRAGIGTGQVVGLLLDRGPHLPIAQLAVMKAGAAWTPLDPRQPTARLAFQLDDTAAPLVLTTTELAEQASGHTPHWCLDEPRHHACPDTPPDTDVHPDDPAYLIYTSGSTGTPKGVLVSHRAAHAFCRSAVDAFAITPTDRVAQMANPSFDGSIFDCYATLLAGATMISAPHDTIADPTAFTALLRDERVTLSFVLPAVLALLDPDALADSALRMLYSGGDVLTAELVNRWMRPGLELRNTYGPTETTVFCTDHRLPDTPMVTPPPIGTALPHQRTYVLDRRLRPVPVGIPGQLFVAGDGVAHGYHNRAALTAQRFLPDLHGDRPGRRMYATGDLVRWRPDGVLEYLGRIDRQVKLRGQRIELGEIEHALTQHRGVRQCAVMLRDNSYLAAYLVGDVNPAEIRTHLAQRLPAYMLPTTYTNLPELPLTPNGKLDTARLPDPGQALAEFVAPRTDTERWLADTWQDLLGIERVGTGDTFFDLGANSLHTTQLTARVRDHLTVDLDPRDLFSNPTLEQLAAHLDETDAVSVVERIPSVQREGGPLVCTYQQEGLWFVQQLDPTSTAYHLGFGTRLRGAMDVPALERAMHALLVRHEALRTRFVAQDGLPRQVIDPPPTALTLPVVDLAVEQVEHWATSQIRQPLDLATGPLFRIALARLAPDEHALVVVVHHIVADGLSARVLVDELAALYAAHATGTPARLPDLPIQPADHAAWQRGWLTGDELSRQLDHWRTHLTDLPTVDFPTDRPRPARPTGDGATLWRHLPQDLAAAARTYARTNHVSFLAVLQAALLSVLHRYTGHTDLPIGSVFSGRTRAELEPLVGYFVNAVVLRTTLDNDPTFTDLVRRCHDTVLDATANQDIPFGLIVDTLQPDRTTGRNPLFQIALSLLPAQGVGDSPPFGEFTTEPIEATTGHARFDLALNVDDIPNGGLDLSIEYSTELFDADRVERLIDHYAATLTHGLAAPDTPVTDLDLLSPTERGQLLHAWNPPPTPHTGGLLHEVTIGHDPGQVAVRFHGAELTYGDLERRSNQLAHALIRAGIGTGQVVGLLLDRGPHLPMAQLAVMKAGAAWTPLDPRQPTARLAFQLDDTAAPLVLTTTELAEQAELAAPHWCLDQPHDARLDACPDTSPDTDVDPDDAAYLIYTSGSTGTPKGVLVPHRAAHAFCRNAVDAFAITPADRVAQMANPSFDGSIFDCYATLLAGATMISAPHQTIAEPAAFMSLLRDEKVTLSFVPPAVLALLDPDALADSALRMLYSGGDVLGAELVNRWMRPGLELRNTYGPTETTVFCTDHRLPSTSLTASPPIGVPLAHQRIYVLDARLQPAPVGVPGQLFIAGDGLAHGYHNRAALTAQRFLPDPHNRQPGRRMYATGDLARRRADGVLEYLGRIDRQVKLRGQRIELGEIEHALTQHPGVRQCAVVLHDNSHLAAYLVGDANPAEIRAHLAQRLPTYMLPTTYTNLPELPLTPNGKLDTARLPEPQPITTTFVAPRTDTERWLADTWQDLLGIERVGTGDTFFDLGANSLHTTQLTARIRDHLDIDLHPRDLYANPTLHQLAALLDGTEAATADEPPADAPPSDAPPSDAPDESLDDEIAALERMLAEKRAAKARRAQAQRPRSVHRDGALACTLQQEGLWFVQQMEPSSSVYHIGFGLRLRGVLVRRALEGALHTLMLRHEALRTRFVAEDGVPRQVVDPAPPVPAPLSTVDIAAGDVRRWVTDQVDSPMDLAAGPLFRAVLARVAPNDHVLALVVHHIVSDGWSVGILAGELSRLYAAAVRGIDAGLPDLPMQPADHASWQRGWLDGAELERQLGYWRTTLADLPTVDFPTDRPRPVQPTGAGANLPRRLPDDIAVAARAYARTQLVSFLAVAQAALLTVLHRYTGQTDLPIGSIFSGRTRPDVEPLVGFFANTLVLRTDVGGDPSFADVVRRCHDTVLDATVHQDVPFGLVVDALQPGRTAGRNPLFQISLTLQPGRGGGGGGGDARLDLGGLTTESIDVATGYARFDLGIDLAESPDGRLDLNIEYSTELFDAGRIERLMDHIIAALAAGLAAPDTPVAEVDLLSPTERDQVLHAWNPPPTSRTDGLLHDVTSGHDPGQVAVRFRDAELTYGELERRSNQLAHALRDTGVGTGHVVGLLLDRGLDLPVAQFAAMRAGAAWTMLDPKLPPARLAFQIADAAARVVLTTTDLAQQVSTPTPLWCLDELSLTGPGTPPDVEIRPDDAAYLLYTSGSTGTPKGVLVSHRSAYAYCQNAVDMFDMTPDDRVVQVSNPAFDVSIFDLYATWLAGATLVGTAREMITDPEAFTALLRTERVTLAYLPPAILGLLDPDELVDSALRTVFSAGEALPTEQANRWLRPGLTLHNSYGPTEATVVCVNHRLPATVHTGPPPIGTALPNHRAYVLDRRLQPVPIGVPGHLYIAGTGVANGYLGRPALTVRSFLADPYGDRPGRRMYATGDLVRRRSDGMLEYLGRIDRQIKLRGQRIELGEIEHALDQHPRIRQSVVVLRDNALAGYVVGDADLDEVRRFLADRLPTYMIPTALVELAELPTTPNGKLDSARLPDPVLAVDHVAPRTDTERWLATAWQDLLDADRIGATDNFFDLGGNSLHATRLTARVRDHFDVDLHPQHLFTNPVLEHLAVRLDQIRDGAAPADTGVVTLRPTGTRPPLFLVHPVGGSVTSYAQLAPMLGDDLPVHAIEDPGLRGEVAADDLAERARRYVELIRRVQPDGPYHLGGWSVGGVIGLEMARHLTDDGATVAVVMALDSGVPPEPMAVGYPDALAEFVRDLAGRAGVPPPAIDLRGHREPDRVSLEDHVLDVLDRAGLAPSALREEVRVRMRVFATNVRALCVYEPRPYGGRLVLVRAAENLAVEEFSRWPSVSPDLEQRTVPGNHHTMMRPPNLSSLAAVLRDVLAGPATASGDEREHR